MSSWLSRRLSAGEAEFLMMGTSSGEQDVKGLFSNGNSEGQGADFVLAGPL